MNRNGWVWMGVGRSIKWQWPKTVHTFLNQTYQTYCLTFIDSRQSGILAKKNIYSELSRLHYKFQLAFQLTSQAPLCMYYYNTIFLKSIKPHTKTR